MRPTRRHLLSISDLSDDEMRYLVSRGAQYATRFAAGTAGGEQPLAGHVVGIYFRKTSTRTRTAFSTGALRLGAQIVTFGPNDLQENTGESSEDTARVLSSMLDVLVARTTGAQEELEGWAQQDRMSVVNAMTGPEHPTQALADLTSLMLHFGRIEDLRLLYIGEGNNTATALARSLTRYPGVELWMVTPPGYGLDAATSATAVQQAEQSGCRFVETHDPAAPPATVDVVYATRWQTTGSSKPDPDWRTIFAPYQVDEKMMARYPDAVFMHDLPAHRGEDVTAEVIDGPTSIAFRQAENKLYSAMAVMEWCALGRHE
ncbi:MAG TPA: ornithine carbamoyltransferase [Pseudonocardiaceae bacterium]